MKQTNFVENFVASVAVELSERARYKESRTLTNVASINLCAAYLMAVDYENEWT